MSRTRLMATSVLCTVALALAGVENSALAQVVPFKVKGGGIAEFIPLPPPLVEPPDNEAAHFAVGKATHLGKYYGDGVVRVDMFTGPTTAAFSSAVPFVFTAANGDDLAFHYGRVDFGAAAPGSVELFPEPDGRFIAVFVAEFNPVLELCTGRFEKLIGGSFIMVATTEAFVLGGTDPVMYTWEGKGTLEFARGK